ncbi:hypothetical protein GCM10009665_50350 [Kitasatospora nipponensis]|uniref:Uncharacterized protein n=1 Tax=Kitasatospora nipponensis TaxID=258049 RepID=A0ABN1WPB1_9ACTN
MWRWALAPVTSLLALRIRAEEPTRMSFDEAWQYARLMLHPDEMVYRRRRLRCPPRSDNSD